MPPMATPRASRWRAAAANASDLRSFGHAAHSGTAEIHQIPVPDRLGGGSLCRQWRRQELQDGAPQRQTHPICALLDTLPIPERLKFIKSLSQIASAAEAYAANGDAKSFKMARRSGKRIRSALFWTRCPFRNG